MSITNWYKEVIKDKVTMKLQSFGGLLDGTMMAGDTQAGTVKFPVGNQQLTMYELTGAIQPVPTTRADVDTKSLTMKDFELTAWWRTQDAYKAGPSEQNYLADIMAMAQRNKRDEIKLEALRAFKVAAPSEVTTIGTGAETPDLLHFELGRAQIAATGADTMPENIETFTLIPEMWASQLAFYEEFAKAEWVGTANMAFSMPQRMRTKTVRGIHYIVAPDSYFSEYESGKLQTFMWDKNSVGCETTVNQERVHMEQVHTMEGSPYMLKNWLSSAALGIRAEGVKEIKLAKITTLIRPPRPTTTV